MSQDVTPEMKNTQWPPVKILCVTFPESHRNSLVEAGIGSPPGWLPNHETILSVPAIAGLIPCPPVALWVGLVTDGEYCGALPPFNPQPTAPDNHLLAGWLPLTWPGTVAAETFISSESGCTCPLWTLPPSQFIFG